MNRLFFPSVVFALTGGTSLFGAACVDTGRLGTTPVGSADASADAVASPLPPDASLDALAGPEPCTDSPVPAGGTSAGPYVWKNVTILGGGFVTGIEFSPAPGGNDVIYARTDVGGAYRWDPAGQQWTALTDWVGRDNSNLMGIESIAPDPMDPNIVYLAAGQYLTGGNGNILRSGDMGTTWTASPVPTNGNIPVPMGGNVDGRNVGERLAVDPNLTSTLYFASRNNGLWTSTDSASTWSKVQSFPVTGPSTYGLSFVFIDKRGAMPGMASSTIYVGVSPGASAQSGSGLYRTTDSGSTWQPVPNQPSSIFPHHVAMDYASGILYFTFNNASGPNNVTAGAVWKLDTSNDSWTKITPQAGKGGYGGVSVDAMHPGTVVVSTLDRWSPDEIYRTKDAGMSWTPIGSQGQRDVGGAAWLYFNGSLSATGWMGDIEIDPHNSGRVLYNTGQGIWWSDDVTASDTGGSTVWAFRDKGLEETVALGLLSPSGGAHLLTAVGDIGGFRHDNFDVSPPNGMFGRPISGNADTIFANTAGFDFAEQHPALIVRVGTTGSGNAGHHGAYSTDGGTTWSPFATEPMGANAGSIAVSADGAAFVWAPQPAGRGAMAAPVYSHDRGATWAVCNGLASGARIAADRVNPNTFYGTRGSQVYVSTDGGASFAASAATLPQGGGQVRPVFGIEGDLWLATGNGLYHSIDSGMSFSQVAAATVQSASAIGFGRGATCSDYPVLYLAGSANGVSGVYRSDDKGSTFRRIDDPQHQFGSISYVSGDPRSYGRAYLGSGGRGILYGNPQ